MKLKRQIFSLIAVLMLFCGMADAVHAAPFANVVYQYARAGNVAAIKNLLDKGYDIDLVNPEGYTALCVAVEHNDKRAYWRLRALGANYTHACLQRVTQEYAMDLEQRYRVVSSENAGTILKSGDDNTMKYAAAGILAAGAVAALALGGGGGGGKDSGESTACPDGKVMVGGVCVTPLECPSGTHAEGSICVSNCLTGEEWNGTSCQPIQCPDGSQLVGNICVPGRTCPDGETLVDGACVPIECPAGTHLVGNACVSSCPTGETWDGTSCQPIQCPDGSQLIGNECVADDACPTGQKMVDGVCVPIECPDNTHLEGNHCVADGDIDKDNNNDDDLYGIYSTDEDVFNLYSSPKLPDDQATILLTNKGNGNVYGMYGFGDMFNSYVVGKVDDAVNPKDPGTGNIFITDEGNGKVYGIYSKIADITQYKEAMNSSAWNEGTAYGVIDIAHTGGGASYGVFGDVRAYNAYGAFGGNSYGYITIRGDGDIYGISGYVAATNAVSPWFAHEVKGNIDLFSEGNGNVYGMMVSKDNIPGAGTGGGNIASWFAFNAYSSGGDDVEGTINIRNTGNGNVYGMYGGQQLFNAMAYGGVDEMTGKPNGAAKGVIKIANYGNGDIYGMYMPEADTSGIIANVNENGSESVVSLVNTGSGVATGLRGGQGTNIINSGEININNLGTGTAVGIYGESNTVITNSGKINIYRESYTDKEDGTVHNPNGTNGGTAYGIYAESGARINNSGEIIVTNAAQGTGIYLERGAMLENTGVISFNGTAGGIVSNGSAIDIYGAGAHRAAVDLNSLGGEIVLGLGGRFFADSLSGNMGVSEKAVLGSFKDEYVLSGSLQAEDVSNLTLNSKSAMFNTASRANENGGYDVILERKSFDKLLDDASLAGFFEKNYNLENAGTVYDNLKRAGTSSALNRVAANTAGTDMIPNFRREDAFVFGNLSRQFNDNLFNHPDENYIGGYKYMDVSTDADGMLMGSDGYANAAYGMLKGKADNGITYGVGASVANLKSDYDNGSSRKSNIFGIWLPAGYDFGNGIRWYSKAYAGYADGSYDRLANLQKYSADFTEYQYGLSNEMRYSMNLGRGFRFEPSAELNLFGVYQDGYDEGNTEGALKADSSNSLSLEGGIGAYLAKEFMFNEDSKLGVQIGGVYYVEFLDPDDGTNATLGGMNGKYKLGHKTNGDRAVLSGRINYMYKNVTVYGTIEQETAGSKGLTIDAGVQYKF